MDQQVPMPPVLQQQIVSQETPQLCPHCHQPVSAADMFCPHCGKRLIDQIGIGKQIWIYAVSFLGPPLGIIYFFRYVGSKQSAIKRIAVIALILTIISTLITVWWFMGVYNNTQQQLQQFQGIGY